MATAIDCSSILTDEQLDAFKADGITHIIRYIDPNPSSWKHMLKAEADRISNKGLEIISAFERAGDKSHITGEYGIEDGTTALEAARMLTQPVASAIYPAVDFQAFSEDMDDIYNYITNFSKAIGDYTCGIYGSFAVIVEMQRRRACKLYWQTLSWSPQQATGINIYQYNIDTKLHGVNVDLNRTFGNEGGWSTLAMDKTKAEIIEAILEECYSLGITSIKNNEGKVFALTQDTIHDCANEVRRVSGQQLT